MTVRLPIAFTECIGLSSSERRAVESLIARCAASDGFDPGLHFDTHLNANRDMPAWRLAWAQGKEPQPGFGTASHNANMLVGVARVFAPTRQEAEISACIDPVFRHQGVCRSLYDGLLAALKATETKDILLACNAQLPSARAIASCFGATPDHAEYRMVLPAEGLAAIKAPETVRLTPVNASSLADYVKLSAAVFGTEDRDWAEFARSMLEDPDREQYTAHTAHGPVGTVALARDGAGFIINGLGVVPERRGRGLGGAILDSCLVVLGRRGADHAALEVDADNAAARALYRSRGFVEAGRTDYWRVQA